MRKEGPQYINERGIQVAQPFNADGSLKEFDEKALKAGIEEMMVDALQQSAGTFLESMGVDELNAAMAKNQVDGGGQYSAPGGALRKDQTKRDLTDDEKATEERIRESIAKGEVEGVNSVGVVDLSAEGDVTTRKVVSKEDLMTAQIEGNPMFEKMADLLEAEPQAVQEMMELLDKSNGNLFSVMTNPKFQKLAQKMMANPELMKMMSDPTVVKDAMKSAQDIGLTGKMGVDLTGDAKSDAAKLAAKATDAIKEGVQKAEGADAGVMPDFLQSKMDKVSDTLSRMGDVTEDTGSVLDQMGVKKDFRKIREVKEEALRAEVEKARAAKAAADDMFSAPGESSESSVEEMRALMQSGRAPARSDGGAKVGENSEAAQETLLYGAGFVIGVGGVLAGLALGLGLIESPFPDNGGVVTPAARRVQTAVPSAESSSDKLKAVQINDDPF